MKKKLRRSDPHANSAQGKDSYIKKHPGVITPVDKLRFIDILTAAWLWESFPSTAYVKWLLLGPDSPLNPPELHVN